MDDSGYNRIFCVLLMLSFKSVLNERLYLVLSCALSEVTELMSWLPFLDIRGILSRLLKSKHLHLPATEGHFP